MKWKALSHSNAVIIFQVYSKILRATRKVLKNAKCTWSSRDCFCSKFYLTAHLLNASLKRKTDNISIILRPITTAERSRAVGMLQQYVSSSLPICIGHRSLNAGVRNAWRPENDEFSLVYRNLRAATFVSRRPGFVNIFGKNGLLVVYQYLAVVYKRLLLPFL